MKKTIAAILLCGLGAPWVEAGHESAAARYTLNDVRLGDRVRIILKSSKSSFVGIVQKVSPDGVTLDFRLELPGVEGSMRFSADQIRRLEILGAWDLSELEWRRTERDRRLKDAEDESRRIAAERVAQQAADESARLKAGSESAEAAPKTAATPALTPEEAQKGLELLKEFPPAEGWGTDPTKTIDWLRSKFAVIGAALTPAERKFVDHYDLWLKAKKLMEASAKEEPAKPGPIPPAPTTTAPEAVSPPAPDKPSPPSTPSAPSAPDSPSPPATPSAPPAPPEGAPPRPPMPPAAPPGAETRPQGPPPGFPMAPPS